MSNLKFTIKSINVNIVNPTPETIVGLVHDISYQVLTHSIDPVKIQDRQTLLCEPRVATIEIVGMLPSDTLSALTFIQEEPPISNGYNGYDGWNLQDESIDGTLRPIKFLESIRICDYMNMGYPKPGTNLPVLETINFPVLFDEWNGERIERFIFRRSTYEKR